MKKSKKDGKGLDKKSSRGISSRFEDKLEKFVPNFPKFIETYHLTYMTLIWSILIILGGYLARENINWLWFVSLIIFFQYTTEDFE